MSGSAGRWLPPGTVSPGLERDLAALVADWALAWFGFALVADGGLRADAPERCGALRVAGEDVAIGLSGDGPGELALGLRSADRGAADRALLGRVGEAVRADLERRVATLFAAIRSDWTGPVDRPAWQPARWQRFVDAEGRLALTLLIGERCFAGACLDRLPPPPPSPPLTPLSQALVGQEVRLSARLGHCTLRLAEMREMVVGNVLLFDMGIDAALPVVVDGAATGIAAARVVREPAQWTLQLETTAFQRAA